MLDQDVVELLLKLDADRADALVRADVGLLDAITAESYTHIESSGTVRNKAEFLASMQKRDFRFDHFTIIENIARLYGNVAILSGRYHNAVITDRGLQPTKHARHLRVYAEENGTWRNVAHQATAIAS